MAVIELPTDVGPALPSARGPLSAWVIDLLAGEAVGRPPSVGASSILGDDDAQLALYCCYELHYRGFRRVDPEWEWSPLLLDLRRRLEDVLVGELRELVGPIDVAPDEVERGLLHLASAGGGPSLSAYVRDEASVSQVREMCVHRSAYQLKEADPHTWCIPRVSGTCKAAMVEIQHDEYGAGERAAMHAVLFADTMAALGLDPTYGAHLDRLPGVTLATTNVISLFGLHRRWHGALVGHLALFEMTSVGPMGRYAEALQRFGLPAGARRFYEVHVEADEEHQHIALERMVRGLLEDEPGLAADVVFGAKVLGLVEGRFAEHLLGSWRTGVSSLLAPIDDAGLMRRAS